MGQVTGTLSGGENICVKIMKASKSQAKVIGIDELFRGLSNIEIDTVARYLDSIGEKGKTMVVIDHTDRIEKYFSAWITLKNQNGLLAGDRLKNQRFFNRKFVPAAQSLQVMRKAWLLV